MTPPLTPEQYDDIRKRDNMAGFVTHGGWASKSVRDRRDAIRHIEYCHLLLARCKPHVEQWRTDATEELVKEIDVILVGPEQGKVGSSDAKTD